MLPNFEHNGIKRSVDVLKLTKHLLFFRFG